jgi:hypothetical protein
MLIASNKIANLGVSVARAIERTLSVKNRIFLLSSCTKTTYASPLASRSYPLSAVGYPTHPLFYLKANNSSTKLFELTRSNEGAFKRSLLLISASNFHISARLAQKETSTPTSQQTSILKDSFKSNLSGDLENISQSDQQKSTSNQGRESASSSNKNGEPSPQGRFAKMFSREHAWKVSLSFFGALFAGSFIYILVDWGSPRLDENKQPVNQ